MDTLSCIAQKMAIDENVTLLIVNKVTPGPGKLGAPVNYVSRPDGGPIHRVFHDHNVVCVAVPYGLAGETD